jgi:hypothetical protein
MSIPRPLSSLPADFSVEELYVWVDGIPLSRPKRNIARDFSDGVLIAEIVSHFRPSSVELHNFISSSSFNQKMLNWGTLNMKVLKKLGFGMNDRDMEDCANVCSFMSSY